MSDDSPRPREVLGTIVQNRGLVVTVRLADGTEVEVSGKRLHRPFGFLDVPIGRVVRLRFHATKPQRMPRIVEVLPEKR